MLRRILLVSVSVLLTLNVFFVVPLASPAMAQGGSDGRWIAYGETVEGTINTLEGDSWFFTGSAGDMVTITMASEVLVKGFSLYGPDGGLLVSSILDGQYDEQANAVYISPFTLPSDGQYTIVARDLAGISGPYTLSLARAEFSLEIGQYPSIARVEHVACGDTDVFFVLSFDSEAAALYDQRVIVQASGDARIIQVFPLLNSQLEGNMVTAIVEDVTVEIAEEILDLSGIGIVWDIAKTIGEELDRQSRTGIQTFTVYSPTGIDSRLRFAIWANRSGTGEVVVRTQWNDYEIPNDTVPMIPPGMGLAGQVVSEEMVCSTATPIPGGVSEGGDVSTTTAPPHNADWTPVIREFDGVEMVLVPAGCFEMGSATGGNNEQPVHQQCFDEPFWIDRYEVTNAQYHMIDSEWQNDNLPRVNVTWYEAWDFCELRGGRLPTEAEWEYAARGPESLQYPWGNVFIGANVAYEGNANQAADVRTHPNGASWVGAFDMSGNVWEWTSTLYRDYPYDADDGRELYTTDGSARVVRGGSWVNGSTLVLRAAYRDRNTPDLRFYIFGFRCARSQ